MSKPSEPDAELCGRCSCTVCSCSSCCRNRNSLCGRRKWLMDLMIGATVGCVLCIVFVVWVTLAGPFTARRTPPVSSSPPPDPSEFSMTPSVTPDPALRQMPPPRPPVVVRHRLRVGVLTLEKYLHTRTTTCNQTWAGALLPHLNYFLHHGGHLIDNTLPLVNLKDLPPSADPYHSAKTFRMLQYHCDEHLEQYDWYLRAVDDMYVRHDQLLAYLNTLDLQRKYYLGQGTLPVEDTAYRVLDGRKYCVGGAGIVLSKPLLTDLCPHLAECEELFNEASSDVELARCIYHFLGIQCHTPAQEVFLHSQESSVLSVMEEFRSHPQSAVLHPVKSTWLMTSVHRKTLGAQLTVAIKGLEDMQAYKGLLGLHITRESMAGGPLREHSATERDDITFFTAHNQSYSSSSCEPMRNTTVAQRQQIHEAVRRANFSCRLGSNVHCEHVLGVYAQRLGTEAVFVVDMLCHNMSGATALSKVALTKQLAPPQLKKLRRREMPRELVLVVSAAYGNPELLDFLLMIKRLSGRVQERMTLFLVLYKHKSKQRYRSSRYYTSSDIRHWHKGRYLDIRMQIVPGSMNLPSAVGEVIKTIHANFSEAIVLVTPPTLHFDSGFLLRCKTMTRAGSHIYHPYPDTKVIPYSVDSNQNAQDYVMHVMWTDGARPVCVHIDDLWGQTQLSNRQTKLAPTRTKRVKVTTSYDIDLHMNNT